MENEKVYLTQEGLEKLKTEHDELVNTRRKEVAEKLQKARELGDVTENAAYDAARDEQAFVEGRISELEDILKRVEVVKKSAAGEIAIGSTVKVHLDGNEQEFQVVGAHEADPAAGKISHESPLGQALLGRKVGEEIKVEAPVGNLTYHILEIK
ncbi:transcription elongation factor GreA [Candidatus Saccharibacteria bacterium]|nr:transcription elongation factor GreA [Candidatus Saccharibacteria bacterium]